MSKQRGPQKLGEILRDFIESKGLADKLKHLEVYSVWEEIVGPAILPHTRVAGLAHHKLYVEVDSAAHLHELRTFHKREILKELKARLAGILIQDIVFRPAGNRS
jgi:predicted nucleic acid-binding Zn ribbon protein